MISISEEHKTKVDNSKRLQKSMDSIFRKISRDIKLTYSEFGSLVDMSQYNQEVYLTLLNRSQIVSNEFKNFESNDLQVSPVILNEIDEETIQNSQDIAQKNADFINDTNARQQDELLIIILDKLQEENAVINNVVVGDELSKEFLKKGLARSPIIGDMVVNESAETSKSTEVTILTTYGIIESNAKYGWFSVLDGKERECHGNADFRRSGQSVTANEPFTVCGELLMYPTDTSLGASASNVINCRCSKRRVT